MSIEDEIKAALAAEKADRKRLFEATGRESDYSENWKVTAQRVRLDSGGYDKHGRYYGGGRDVLPLYEVQREKPGSYDTIRVRATDSKHAKLEAFKRPGYWGGWK